MDYVNNIEVLENGILSSTKENKYRNLPSLKAIQPRKTIAIMVIDFIVKSFVFYLCDLR